MNFIKIKIISLFFLCLVKVNSQNESFVYLDPNETVENRVNDLMSRMTLEEKVGQMFHPPFILEPDLLMFLYEVAIRGNKLTESHIVEDNITHFNLYGNPSPVKLGSKINYLQKIASRTRLGIPITISSDPIHEVPRGCLLYTSPSPRAPL